MAKTDAVVKKKKSAGPKRKTPSAKGHEPEAARSVQAEILDSDEAELRDGELLEVSGDAASDLGMDARDYGEQVAKEAAEWESRGWVNRAGNGSVDGLNADTEPAYDDIKSLLPTPTGTGSKASDRALATADPIAQYMAEVRRYPLLTREQEQALATRYRETGDKRAAEALVTSNLRFVVKVAAEYSRFGARLIDLVQEGNVGLMHAVREFNPYKGVRLITYAVWWIRGYIQDYLMRQYSMVRIGTTQSQRKLFYRLQKEKDLLESMGEEPSTKLLSSRLGVSEADVESMTQRMQGRDVSLQSSVDDSGRTTMMDFEAVDEVPVDEQIGNHEMLSLLHAGIEELKDSLNDRERELLEDRLLAEEPLTLQEIGEKYGVTREAVRQMENRLMLKIRKILEERMRAR